MSKGSCTGDTMTIIQQKGYVQGKHMSSGDYQRGLQVKCVNLHPVRPHEQRVIQEGATTTMSVFHKATTQCGNPPSPTTNGKRQLKA